MRSSFVKVLFTDNNKKTFVNVCVRHFKYFTSADYPTASFNKLQQIDLRSDTVSKLNLEMRTAMFEAEVGDDVFGEDPTVNELERKASALTGKEAAIYVPTGTMSNLIAILAHCEKRNSEIIVGSRSHIQLYEQTGAAQFGGINVTTVTDRTDGTFDLAEVDEKFRPDDIHCPCTALICAENTHNVCGGKVLPQKWIDELAEFAARRGIPLHLDGARLWNASVHSGKSIAELSRPFQTVSLCLSKGLGAPYGSVLVGPSKFIRKARYLRKALGGGSRQIGVLAATGIYGIDHIFPKLKYDHIRTQRVANAIREMESPDITVTAPEDIHTNILMITCHNKKFNAEDFELRLRQVTEDELIDTEEANTTSVLIMAMSKKIARIVLHFNITDEQIEKAIKKIRYVIKEHDENVQLELRAPTTKTVNL